MEKVFILGNPRSGTSLFRLMLNAHPKIIAPPECGFLHWWFDKYKDWNLDCVSSDRLDEYLEDLKSSKKIEDWHLDFSDLKEMITQQKPDNYEVLGEIVYKQFSKQKGKNPFVIADKNNYYINHLADLNLIWPKAKFILIVRDGRDVACSYLDINKLETSSPYKPKLPTNLTAIANEWVSNNSNIINFINALENERGLIVKYEDVVLDTERSLSKVCDFLGVNFDIEMLSYYIKNAEQTEEPLSTIDWKKKTLEKPDETNVGRYRQVLTETESYEFNKVAEFLLQKLNYRL